MKPTTTELTEILKSHSMWLNKEGGERANLTGADLTGADLRGTNISEADLRAADL